MEDQIQLIDMSLIDRPVKIARETIDPERVRELAESIRESGLLQPVVLRAVNGRYEMVAGDRRYLAHKLLGEKAIKAIVRQLDDRETVVIRGIENLQRENLTPSEQGRVYMLLHDEGGFTWEQVAGKVGKKIGTIERYVRFARLPDELRRPVDEKKMSIESLEILRDIDDAEIFKMYFANAAGNGITPRVARMWVEEWRDTKAGTFYSDGGGVPALKIEDDQKPIFYTCEGCLGPCEIRKIRNVGLCPECLKAVKGSRCVKS